MCKKFSDARCVPTSGVEWNLSIHFYYYVLFGGVYDGDSVKHTLTHMGALLCAPHFKAKKTVFSLYDIFCGIVNFHRSVTASGVEARGRATDSCAARVSQTN